MATPNLQASFSGTQPRRGGRPRLAASERRKMRGVRYTDAEWNELVDRAHSAGMTTAEYIRETSLGARVTSPYGPRPVDPQLVSQVNALCLQLSGLGNLLNQVMPYAHNNEQIPTDWARQWEHLPAEIKKAQQEAKDVLALVLNGHVH